MPELGSEQAEMPAPEAGAPESLEAARQATVEELARQATAGVLTLDEYAERALAIEQAADAGELEAAVRGLPEQRAAPAPEESARWLIGIFGGTEQRGRWRLSSHLRIVALLGGLTLDLGMAQPEVPESMVTVIAILGGVEIIAPPGVPIQLSGFSLLGGKSDERSGGPPLGGAPLVRLRCVTFLGGVKVKDRPPRRNLLDVIRARREGPRTG